MNTSRLAQLIGFASVILLTACGGGGGGGGARATDTAAPTATVATNAPAVPDPALIPADAVITVTFSESMDTTAAAWKLGGDLAGESDGGVWSTTAVANDTLTVKPAGGGAWFAKPDRTLTLEASDLAGNPLTPLTVSYDVYRGTLYYVDVSVPNNTSDGSTPDKARKFIHTAVANAQVPATILVKAGDYRLSHELGTQVVLRGGVSLYGGYNADFTTRDPATNIATIADRSTTGGSSIDPRAAMVGDGTVGPIGSDTVVDGFTILATLINGTNSVCWNIAENVQADCQPSQSTVPTHTAAIALRNGASPTIENNTLHGGGGIGGTFSSGVFNYEGASPGIHNNTIHGGNNSTHSNGIANANASPTIRNNTIYGGEGGSSRGIYNSGATSSPANPHLENNIVFTRSAAATSCIVGSGPDPRPSTLRNNDLWNCAIVYMDDAAACVGNADGDNDAHSCGVSELNALTGIPGGVSGNISVNPLFADVDGADNIGNTVGDNNWRFSPGSPGSVTAGGLNGILEGWPFTAGKDGVARPPSGHPWSIGAYEP